MRPQRVGCLAFGLLLLIGLASGFMIAACSSPTAPTPNGPNPQPAPGTTVQTIPLPGTDQPLLFWIIELSPAKGTQLQVGQTGTVKFTCGGPEGFTAYIGVEFMSEEYIAETVQNGNPLKINSDYRIGGSTYRVFARCDTTTSRSFTVGSKMPDVTHILAQVWVAQGSELNTNRPPDKVFTESLDWKKP